MVSIYLNHDLSCTERRGMMFDGHLLLYTRRDATVALADHAMKMISEAFAPLEPERAQFDLEIESFIERISPLRKLFTNDLRTKELIRAILVSFNCDLDDTYFDVPRLRVIPTVDYLSSGMSYNYKAHRDPWYANSDMNINWWMPVFPVTHDRALAFFPEYWTKSLRNSSAEFNHDEWCNVGRTQAASQIKKDTRKHPLPLESFNTESELRIVGNKGDILLFSATHLHASVPNQSGLTRFSVDFRTASLSDIKNKRGAPSIDNQSTGTTLQEFLRASDFKPIDTTIISSLIHSH